jgi:hypothetical protein
VQATNLELTWGNPTLAIHLRLSRIKDFHFAALKFMMTHPIFEETNETAAERKPYTKQAIISK